MDCPAAVHHGQLGPLEGLQQAEAAYREVQQAFLQHGVLYSVALVSLDLALLLSRQGRTEELKRLAAELMTVLSAQEIHREATAALVLFQRACEEERSRPN